MSYYKDWDIIASVSETLKMLLHTTVLPLPWRETRHRGVK